MNGSVTAPAGLTAGLTGLIVALSPSGSDGNTMNLAIYPVRADYHYRSANVITPIDVLERPLVGDPVVDFYRPRSELGRKLIELRRAYVLGGGTLLSWDEIDTEMRERRGGLSDA